MWKLWHTTLIIFKIRRRKKSQITETTITCMLVQGHKINVETEQKPIDNHIHHECCRKEALNPVIVTKCIRAMMKYYRSLTHFCCETTSRILLDQCCGVTVTSTRSGGHYKKLLNKAGRFEQKKLFTFRCCIVKPETKSVLCRTC